jgi:hypothetical protein
LILLNFLLFFWSECVLTIRSKLGDKPSIWGKTASSNRVLCPKINLERAKRSGLSRAMGC